MRNTRRFALFVTVSGFAAFANLLARVFLSRWISFEIAVVCAYAMGMTVAFLLNKRLVFAEDRAAGMPNTGQYAKFVLVNMMALVQVFVVSVTLAKLIFPAIGFHWHAETIGHLVGLGSPVFISYWAHKHFTFRRRADQDTIL